jgi:hypothetical protein
MGDANGIKYGPVAALTHTATDRTRPVRTQRTIIFLDIDGVLNRSSGYARLNHHVVEMDLLARLLTRARQYLATFFEGHRG